MFLGCILIICIGCVAVYFHCRLHYESHHTSGTEVEETENVENEVENEEVENEVEMVEVENEVEVDDDVEGENEEESEAWCSTTGTIV